MSIRILLIEDDVAVVEFIRLGLGYEGYDVSHAPSAEAALRSLRSTMPDLIVLDVSLPGLSGLDLLKRLRQEAITVPVIILSAQTDVSQRVAGLEIGADDYLTKPFRFEELLARIRAVMRRGSTETPKQLACGPLAVDPERHEVRIDGAVVDLTAKEFSLLEVLVHNAGRVLTREVLLSRVWGLDWVGDTNLVEVHVSKLRRKLEQHGDRQIHTVRGVGYVLRAPSPD